MPREAIAYCTNVHPGETLAEIEQALRHSALPLRRRFADERFPLGLRLGERAVRDFLEDPAAKESFLALLDEGRFSIETMNVFPQGTFHSDGTKEKVYLPDWTHRERLRYTLDAARVLAEILPSDRTRGTLSTVPLGFRRSLAGREDAAAALLLEAADGLAALEIETGRRLVLCLEPEPECLLETTAEVCSFFEDHLLRRAEARGEGAADRARRHVGVCYDVCHAAVCFEEPSYDFLRLRGAGIEVAKVQLSCALELPRPTQNAEGVERLRAFQEPRFLHQVQAIGPDRERLRWLDLPDFLRDFDSGAVPELDCVRCHFHVPLHLPDTWPLATTVEKLHETFTALQGFEEQPHLEVETYTFEVLPRAGTAREGELLDSLEQEIRFAMNGLTPESGGGPAA